MRIFLPMPSPSRLTAGYEGFSVGSSTGLEDDGGGGGGLGGCWAAVAGLEGVVGWGTFGGDWALVTDSGVAELVFWDVVAVLVTF